MIIKNFPSIPPSDKETTSSKASSFGKSKTTVNIVTIVNSTNVNSKSIFPPFVLTFEIFNYNVHNCLVDSGASTNVIPLPIVNKIKSKPEKMDAKII